MRVLFRNPETTFDLKSWEWFSFKLLTGIQILNPKKVLYLKFWIKSLFEILEEFSIRNHGRASNSKSSKGFPKQYWEGFSTKLGNEFLAKSWKKRSPSISLEGKMLKRAFFDILRRFAFEILKKNLWFIRRDLHKISEIGFSLKSREGFAFEYWKGFSTKSWYGVPLQSW